MQPSQPGRHDCASPAHSRTIDDTQVPNTIRLSYYGLFDQDLSYIRMVDSPNLTGST